ncbi:ABC transporter substrate-binding protein [Streptomyces mirabilis]|uniref:ABC transporter substrate-binding protein n=1 Tax=Streptomyces mirabilis TaxID=68239 RepID=UPI00331C92B6
MSVAPSLSRSKRLTLATACAALLALTVSACGSGSSDAGSAKNGSGSSAPQPYKGQTVTVAGVWTGAEAAEFKKVLAAFTERTGVKTTFVSTGDNLSTVVGSQIAGGNPMDVVMAPQPGVLAQFARKGYLAPLSTTTRALAKKNFATSWVNYGSVDGTLYGLYFKASYKSLIWYDPTAWSNAGLSAAPTTFDELLKDGQTLSDSGVPAFSVAGQDGWPLTDWFESVYLSQAGPTKYDQLTQHKIPWTDPSVTKALTSLGRIFKSPALVAGGNQGALHTDFPTSVNEVFGPKPKAALTYEGDFVGGNITALKKKVGVDAKFFPFPSVDGGEVPAEGGGDAAAVVKSAKHQAAAQSLVAFLATPEAAAVWAKDGGYLSPNKNLALSQYPDSTTRSIAKLLVNGGDQLRFDMSDQAPAAFGGTAGSGEWKILQDFLAKPADIKGTEAKLEAAAVQDYRG